VGLKPKLYTVFPQQNGAEVLLSADFSHDYRPGVELPLASFAIAYIRFNKQFHLIPYVDNIYRIEISAAKASKPDLTSYCFIITNLRLARELLIY
jgi:hypothetical protein